MTDNFYFGCPAKSGPGFREVTNYAPNTTLNEYIAAKNQLNRDDCYGFRFLHNTERNKLYVWDCKQPWMHQQVFDMVDMDWGKSGTNVIGIFEPEGVAVWEELAEDGEASSSIRLAKKLDGEFFKQLYPNGYQITTCC